MIVFTRRRFLQGMTAAGVAAASGLPACSPRDRAIEPATPRPAKPILVVIDIDGGNDWLNVMPPVSGQNRVVYEQVRPTLAVPASGIVEIGSGIGLNSDFTGMSLLSDRGRVAWLPGVGMNNPNLSHFVSIDLWGQGSAQPGGTGWLGRFADVSFAPAGDVLRGVTVTSDLPVMLRGQDRSFVSITGSSGYVYPASLRGGLLGAPWDAASIEAGFDTALTTADPGGPPGYPFAAQAGKSFLDATNGFGVNGTLPARTPSVPYPGDANYPVRRNDGGALSGSLSRQLKLIAQMLASGIDAEVFFARLSGWDTHANQATDHPNLMRTLGGSISAFYDDLASVSTDSGNAQERTLVLAWSEFGRRVEQNNNGTDHGTAGLAFCVGRGVTGGFYGAYPNLSDLDSNGNMKFTVDFRSLYATVLERWLGLSAAATDALLLQGASLTPYPRLGFV